MNDVFASTRQDALGAPELSPFAPDRVRIPVMFQQWTNISFVHWRYDPQELQHFLPRPLQIDTFDGDAWVSLTPFRVRHLRPPCLPSLPWLSSFPETNVRTYVRALDGSRGI